LLMLRSIRTSQSIEPALGLPIVWYVGVVNQSYALQEAIDIAQLLARNFYS
jgi:hypothetical protein